MSLDDVLIWTYQLVGGERFSIHLANNPAAHHDGGVSVWHLRVNGHQSEEVQAVARNKGVRITGHALTETAEQTEMHNRYMEAETSLFPCVQCPSCYWLDLQVEGYCGAESWPKSRRVAAVEAFSGALQDLENCPVRE